MSALRQAADPGPVPSAAPRVTEAKAPSLAAALYRLLVHGAAVPRLLAAGAGSSAWLATMWALGWPQSSPVYTLVGLAAGLGLALAWLPRQLGLPWPLVLAGLAMMGWAQDSVGLWPAMLVIFVMVGGLLAPQVASQGRAPLVRMAWALVSAVLLFAAIALLQWAVQPLRLNEGGRELTVYAVLLYCLLSGAPGWWLSWLQQRHPLRPARWMALATAGVWRAGVGLALYGVLAGQWDGWARAVWRQLQGGPLEVWAAPLAWGLAVPALLAVGGLVWWVPVGLARARLRGWLSSRAVADALATGGVGASLFAAWWALDMIGGFNGPLLRGALDRPVGMNEFQTGFVALLASLAVNVLVRLALGRPVDAQQRALWVLLPRATDAAAHTPRLPPTLYRRARLLASHWPLGPVTLVAASADAPALAGDHLVVAQEAGVAHNLFTASSLGDEWQREWPGPQAWRALPVRHRFLSATGPADWAEVARWVSPEADVVVLLDDTTSGAVGSSLTPAGPSSAAAQALCRHLPVDRSRVWSTAPGHDSSDVGRLPRQATPVQDRAAETLWITRLVDQARGQAAARRRVLLLHGQSDAAFAGQLLSALRAGRDRQGLAVRAGALAYPDDEGGTAATRVGGISSGFVKAVLRDGVLWDLLMAEALGMARRGAASRGGLGRWLTTLGMELARDGRPLDVLVLETGLPGAPARAQMPDQSGADRLVALWPAELPADAPPFYAAAQYQHRLPLPPRSAWHARTAESVAEAVLRGDALPPFAGLSFGEPVGSEVPIREVPIGEVATSQVATSGMPPASEAMASEAPASTAEAGSTPASEASVGQAPTHPARADTPPVTLTIRSMGDHGWQFACTSASIRWEERTQTAHALVHALAAPLQTASRLPPEWLGSLAELVLPARPGPLAPEEGEPLLLAVDDASAWLPWEAMLQVAGWVGDDLPVWRQAGPLLRPRPPRPGMGAPGPWRLAGPLADSALLEAWARRLNAQFTPRMPNPAEVQIIATPDPEDALAQALHETDQGPVLVFSRSPSGVSTAPATALQPASRKLLLAAASREGPGLLLLDHRQAVPVPASPSSSLAAAPMAEALQDAGTLWPGPREWDLLWVRGVRCVVTWSGGPPPQGGEEVWLRLLEALADGHTAAEAVHQLRHQLRHADPQDPAWVQMQGWGDPMWRMPLPLK